MSERSAHLAAASTNCRAAAVLRTTSEGNSWVPTLLYYAVVQLFEAAEAPNGLHNFTTEERMAALAARFPEAMAGFRKLRQLSEAWRFQAIAPSERDLSLAQVWAQEFAAAIGERWPELPEKTGGDRSPSSKARV